MKRAKKRVKRYRSQFETGTSPLILFSQATGQENANIDRKAIAGMLMELFDRWQLSTEEQLDALGLPTTSRAILTKYRRGEPILASRDTMERAGHLLGIHKNLRLLFPHNSELAYVWIKTFNKAFENRSPIEVIRENGFSGLQMVLTYLDQARGSECETLLNKLEDIELTAIANARAGQRVIKVKLDDL